MARYDKYSGVTGGFRAPLAADFTSADYDKVVGAGLDATGKVVRVAGNSGFVGVFIADRTKRKAGDIQDVMTDGEIVDCTGLVAGTTYFLDAAGLLTTAATTGVKVGHTVEADRLVVRFQRGA